MKGRTVTRNDGKIAISSLTYKMNLDTDVNFEKIVDLILVVDARLGGDYNRNIMGCAVLRKDVADE